MYMHSQGIIPKLIYRLIYSQSVGPRIKHDLSWSCLLAGGEGGGGGGGVGFGG